VSGLGNYETVQRWLRSARFAADDPRLGLLDEFCALTGQNPDKMIAECLKLVQDGQFRLRGLTRRRYVERIEEFEQARGGRAHGNVIRSFFIHNGVPIQPPILS
jgi:hypothetical protein